MDLTKPETKTVAINLNDRRSRKVVFLLNHDQQCVTAAWIEDDLSVPHDQQVDGSKLYRLLAGIE